MSYRGKPKGSYGNQKRGRFPWGSKKSKPKENRENIVYVKDDPEPRVAPESINWQPRPLAQDVKVFLSRPTTLTANGQKVLLPSDLTQQSETAYQISLLAESQRLSLEAVSSDGSIRKYRIIKINSQLPTDKPLSFSDYPLVGNLKNTLRPHGYTLIAV